MNATLGIAASCVAWTDRYTDEVSRVSLASIRHVASKTWVRIYCQTELRGNRGAPAEREPQ